ncbi:MAG TPA: DUF2505 domain-containing protein [Mycobacteriales bacterium]|nr:DUF2505 domain-containing protein [Mycobacteriales bacterium]
MSKRMHAEHDIDADVESVHALLASERWPAAKNAALKDGSRVVRCEQTASGGTVLEVSRELPAGVPGFLERFLPQDGRVTQTDSWEPPSGDTRRGTWTVTMPGAPVTMGGTMRVEPGPRGSRYVVDGEVHVKVPVIGGKAEGFVAGMFDKLSAKEAEVLRGALPG